MDVVEEMEKLTLAILGDTIFRIDLLDKAGEVGLATVSAGKLIMERATALVATPLALPTPRNRRLRQAVAVLDSAVSDIIAERRKSGRREDDLLSMLMEARDQETGETMSDQQLRDEEVFTFLQAGHQTVVCALAWTWYLLALPDVEQKRDHEVSRVLGGRVPTVQDVPHLDYMMMAIHEAMRLYPPAWIVPRTAINDDEIDGYRIPGSSVLLSQYLTHRRLEFWPDPERLSAFVLEQRIVSVHGLPYGALLRLVGRR